MIRLSPIERRSDDIKKNLIGKMIGENWCGEIALFCSDDLYKSF